MSTQLNHHGIKGMKWGRRRYQNDDGSLTSAGIKRYAEKGYKQDASKSHKTTAGKIYGKITDSDKLEGQIRYANSSKKANKARAEQYLKDQRTPTTKKNSPKKANTKASMKSKSVIAAAAKGAAKTAAYLNMQSFMGDAAQNAARTRAAYDFMQTDFAKRYR